MIFFVLNWKKIQTLCIFYALFVYTFSLCADLNNVNNKILGSVDKNFSNTPTFENIQNQLHSVLLKNLKNSDTQEKILFDLKSVVPDEYNQNSINMLNKELVEYVVRNKKEGNILLYKFSSFCKYINDAIYRLAIPDEEKLKIECRIDELVAAVEKFGIDVNSTSTEVSKDSCRVLKINDNLGVFIIPKGYYDGIRVGRNLQLPNAGNVRAAIISVRKFVSAAILLDGNLKEISPGMLVNLKISEN